MPLSTSLYLTQNKNEIMNLWVARALKEVEAAKHQQDLALRNSLPEYLDHLADALSSNIDRTEARALRDKLESTRIGKLHGKERASSFNYTMDQVIFEYHILRQVLCDVLDREKLLTSVEREIIVCSIEQAVNDAATQFGDTLKEIQDQFTDTLTHDLRTPLTAARLNLQLILRKPDDSDHTIQKASKGVGNLNRLDRMIQDLLDGSRMKAGQNIALDFSENCDLDWIIKEVISDLGADHDVVFQSSGSCTGRWNENGLRRVVENLLTNAIKYGEHGRPITITLNCTKETAAFTVHNEGKPIAKGEFPVLFQQFRRLRSNAEKMGWGLGLSVVKGITESHKGHIEVKSEAGYGTSFTVTLPKES